MVPKTSKNTNLVNTNKRTRRGKEVEGTSNNPPPSPPPIQPTPYRRFISDKAGGRYNNYGVIFKKCVKLMESFFVCLVLTHLLKMVNLNEKYGPLTILSNFINSCVITIFFLAP
jgi:hypothetical protein